MGKGYHFWGHLEIPLILLEGQRLGERVHTGRWEISVGIHTLRIQDYPEIC